VQRISFRRNNKLKQAGQESIAIVQSPLLIYRKILQSFYHDIKNNRKYTVSKQL
jgi:hypothetical protein